MINLETFEVRKVQYVSMYEMMQHIKQMSDAGYYLTSFTRVNYVAEYKKDLP